MRKLYFLFTVILVLCLSITACSSNMKNKHGLEALSCNGYVKHKTVNIGGSVFYVTGHLTEESIELKHSSKGEGKPPFGKQSQVWNSLKNIRKKEGGCWFFFTSPKSSWNSLSGREGYFLLSPDLELLGGLFTKIS